MAAVDILLPTCDRLTSLVFTLSGVAAQSFTDMRVVVSEQGAEPIEDEPVLASLRRIIKARGGTVEWHRRVPSQGIAEQRHFLLSRATAPCVLYIDDDVFMEPWVLEALVSVLDDERCGFVGAFPTGLSFRDDVRPKDQGVEFWDGPVRAEVVEPGSPEWDRARLHAAANAWHAARKLPPGEVRRYKVAWVACCVLYDREKLRSVGGFDFWQRLPRYHSGEEVLVQNLLMRRYGGCAILPSGTYHSQLPSTVLNDAGTVDGHALELLPEMAQRYCTPGGSSTHPSLPDTIETCRTG